MDSGTYTPQGGYNTASQGFQSLNQALATIQGMTPQSVPQVTPQQVSNADATSLNFNQQIPQQMQQAQNSLTQQSGIPSLQNQQNNLGQIFSMYLADQNLSQKYSSPQLSSPNSPVFQGDTQGNNPYLGKTPQQLIDTVVQPSGQGFQGFTNPNLITGAMGQAPQAATNMIDLLNQAIGTEQGIVQNKLGDVSQNYQAAASTLSMIANLLGQTYQNQLALKQSTASSGYSGFPPGSTQEASAAFDDILKSLGSNATPNDVWSYINSHQTALRKQGINVDELWRLQKDLVNHIGKGVTQSGKVTKSKVLQPKESIDSKGQKKVALPNGTVLVGKSYGGLFGTPIGAQQPIDPVQFYANAKSEGYTDQQIINYLKQHGWQ